MSFLRVQNSRQKTAKHQPLFIKAGFSEMSYCKACNAYGLDAMSAYLTPSSSLHFVFVPSSTLCFCVSKMGLGSSLLKQSISFVKKNRAKSNELPFNSITKTFSQTVVPLPPRALVVNGKQNIYICL